MKLELLSYQSGKELVANSTKLELDREIATGFAGDISVAKIDPKYKGGDDFCEIYEIDKSHGANCVVLEAKRGDEKWYAAALVPVGIRMDIGGSIRRRLKARKVSMAPLDYVISQTGMEFGSITVIGLPEDWQILIDSRIAELENVFIGSGLVQSKLSLPGNFFKNNNRYIICDDLEK